MKRVIFTLAASLILCTYIYPQYENVKATAELEKIYSNLEYNTTAFNDLKKKWIINDPVFIREIYNRFVVKDALRLDGKKVPDDEIIKKSNDIYDGNIIIELRKRYYDDEIEYFAFKVADELNGDGSILFFDPVTDGFYLKSIIGNTIYKKIQEQTYYFTNLTKTEFNTKSGYYFDLNLNMLNMDVVFWSSTSDYKNKYLLSVFGKWGNDYIYLPGWYLGDYIGGLKVTYYEKVSNNPLDYTYMVGLGMGFISGNPFPEDLPASPLFKTGSTLYGTISGTPFEYLIDGLDHFYVTAEGYITISDFVKDTYRLYEPTDFYSMRNYFCVGFKKRKLFNLFDFGMFEIGAGVGIHDIYYFRALPNEEELIDLEPQKTSFDKFTHYPYLEIGVEKIGGLVQHHITSLVGYDFYKRMGYVGVQAKIMVSDIFGFDVRYYNAINFQNFGRDWRSDSYLVFSPILRINY